MTDSNDKLDDELPKDEAPLPTDAESELDAKLLEAAQRWAEEFNPSLGEEPAEEDLVLSSEERTPKSRKKSNREKIEVKVEEVSPEVDDAHSEIEETFPAAAEITFEELESEAVEEDIIDQIKIDHSQSDGEEAATEFDPEPELVLTTKKPKKEKKNKKTEEVSSEGSAELITQRASEPSIEPEIVDDDKQGLMRWDEAINLEAQVEAILFAAPKPISVSEIAETLADDDGIEPDHSTIDSIVQSLLRLYKERNGGFRLEYDKGQGYQFRTVPAAAPIMERMFSSRQRPLSRAAHETLAIIAYRQPCTRADIEFIRGVDAGSIIKNLLERDLVACVGRKEDSGRPMLFGTTAEFMRVFRIQSLNDLPPLSAFQPATEAIIDAFQKIESPDVDVDIEDFIGDDNREQPEISGDLSADFAKSTGEFEVREDGSDSSAGTQAKVRRSGGIFDNEGFLSNDGYENTEVVVPARDSVTPGSGEDASRGSDKHQRQGGARTGDEDPT